MVNLDVLEMELTSKERMVLGREVHPIAALFPMLGDEELGDLATDIKQRGLRCS